MASSGNSPADALLLKLGLQPVTKCSLAKFYVPALGITGYTGLAVNVMNPEFTARMFPKVDTTNVFLGTSLVGIGSFIYTREHMKPASPLVRVLYSFAGALLFNFGSVLLWAVVRSVVTPNHITSTLAGIGTGYVLVKGGHSYFQLVDSQVAKK